MSDKLIVTVDSLKPDGRDVMMTQKDCEPAVFLMRNIGRRLSAVCVPGHRLGSVAAAAAQ